MARLKEWIGAELDGDVKKNQQYANLLIDNKIFVELVRLDRGVPFPPAFADALEWILMAADEVPATKKKCTSFPFIYRNFEKIMKKQTT